jgi:hypothetical protein
MGEAILAKLSRQLDAISGLKAPEGPSTVSASEIESLKAENADIKAQLATILARLNPPPIEPPVRRI